MTTSTTNKLMHETAEELRRSVASRAQVWQMIPFWTLESEGRGGWSDNWGLPYRYGILGVDTNWPHRVFVECATGRLVSHRNGELVVAPDEQILAAYTLSPEMFEAVDQLALRIDRATNGKDTYNKEVNDEQRDEMRERLQVPIFWTTLAKPIQYRY